MRNINQNLIKCFERNLYFEEKAECTVKQYVRCIECFTNWLNGRYVEKSDVIAYKKYLCDKYADTSVNTSLAALNHFFCFMEWYELKVKNLKIQRQIFTTNERELTKAEYEKLLNTAKRKKNERLYLLMQTICSTGIRVSELKFITVEALKNRCAQINCKGKRRKVFLPDQLCASLKFYIKSKKIKSGPIFVTKSGKPLDRSNVWSDMKKLCREAGVSDKKVFPHNLRHLFAHTYYTLQKDIVRLADILGHSNINTTRIYTIESGEIHRKQLQRLGLLLC